LRAAATWTATIVGLMVSLVDRALRVLARRSYLAFRQLVGRWRRRPSATNEGMVVRIGSS
jgi:hypothetical protein